MGDDFDTLLEYFDDIDFEKERNEIDKFTEENKNICFNCNKKDTLVADQKQGYIVCNNCGQVNENVLDDNPEWHNYEDGGKDDVARCSSTNTFFPQSSLSTTIAGSSYGKLQTLNRWNAMPYSERSLFKVLQLIQGKCREANIMKKTEDDAKIIYKIVSECKHVDGKNKGKTIIIRGDNREGLIAICIYLACVKNKDTRSTKEVAKLFNLKSGDMSKGRKTFKKLMRYRHELSGIQSVDYGIRSSIPEDYIPRFCRELGLHKKYSEYAIKLAQNIKILNIATTHTSISLATACILLVINLCDLTVTKKSIAQKFSVSEVTITKAYKSIIEYKDIITNQDKVEQILSNMKKQKQEKELPDKLKERYNKYKQKYRNNRQTESEEKNNVTINNINFYEKMDKELHEKIRKTEDRYKRLMK